MPSKALAMIAALPLIAQLGACAAPAPRAQHSDTNAVAGQKATSPAAPTSQDAKDFAAAVRRGDAAWQAGDLDRAVYHYVMALERSPHDAPTLAKIGAIEESRGNIAQAEKAFEMARSADPQEPRIGERLAGLYLHDQKYDRAGQLYAEVLALYPQRSRALDGMGEVCLARSEYAHSIHYFDQALQAEKADAGAVLTHRGYAKLQSGDLQGAEADLRAALVLGPRADARRYLAELQVHRGDTASAFESMLNVMDAAQAYNEVGMLLMHVNNYRDAQQYFAKAVSASAVWYEEAHRNLAVVDAHLRDAAEKAPQPLVGR